MNSISPAHQGVLKIPTKTVDAEETEEKDTVTTLVVVLKD